jgi:hypothetical protein
MTRLGSSKIPEALEIVYGKSPPEKFGIVIFEPAIEGVIVHHHGAEAPDDSSRDQLLRRLALRLRAFVERGPCRGVKNKGSRAVLKPCPFERQFLCHMQGSCAFHGGCQKSRNAALWKNHPISEYWRGEYSPRV